MTAPKDVTTDLCERLHILRLRYQVVFHELSPANPPYIPMAEALLRGLGEGDAAAVTHLKALVDEAEMDRPAFWGTDLGRLLFAAGAREGATVSQTVAAAVLGCSRQWVSAMVAENKLTPTHYREVYADEVRKVLKARVDRLVNNA